jgi:hypothetical protein
LGRGVGGRSCRRWCLAESGLGEKGTGGLVCIKVSREYYGHMWTWGPFGAFRSHAFDERLMLEGDPQSSETR